MLRIAVIGAGTIGEAIAKALLKSGYKVTATRRRTKLIRNLEKLGATITSDNRKAAEEADLIIVSVKPKDVKAVLKEIRSEVKGKVVISVAAAINLRYMKAACPEAIMVRVMPNIAILVQESLIAYCTDSEVTPKTEETIKEVLGVLGKPVKVEEFQMDAITALNGCAPAYLSVIIEALTYAGLEVGLPRTLALLSAAQSMIGTGKLILEAGKNPLQIRDMVTTPGGITVRGLLELESVPIRYAIMKAVKKAMLRSKEISETIREERNEG